MMGTMSSATMQSLGEMNKARRLYVRKYGVLCFYRKDAAKQQTAGIKLTYRPKIRFFAPQGRLLAMIHVKHRYTSNLAWPTGTWIRLAVQNFTSIVAGVGMRPSKYQKFSLFGKVAS